MLVMVCELEVEKGPRADVIRHTDFGKPERGIYVLEGVKRWILSIYRLP